MNPDILAQNVFLVTVDENDIHTPLFVMPGRIQIHDWIQHREDEKGKLQATAVKGMEPVET